MQDKNVQLCLAETPVKEMPLTHPTFQSLSPMVSKILTHPLWSVASLGLRASTLYLSNYNQHHLIKTYYTTHSQILIKWLVMRGHV